MMAREFVDRSLLAGRPAPSALVGLGALVPVVVPDALAARRDDRDLFAVEQRQRYLAALTRTTRRMARALADPEHQALPTAPTAPLPQAASAFI